MKNGVLKDPWLYIINILWCSGLVLWKAMDFLLYLRIIIIYRRKLYWQFEWLVEECWCMFWISVIIVFEINYWRTTSLVVHMNAFASLWMCAQCFYNYKKRFLYIFIIRWSLLYTLTLEVVLSSQIRYC